MQEKTGWQPTVRSCMWIYFIAISLAMQQVLRRWSVIIMVPGIQKNWKVCWKKSSALILISSALMFGVSELMAKPLAGIFVGYDAALLDMTAHGFSIYAVSFIFAGIAIFGSAFFTALNDGLTSAVISFLRTLLFECASVMILPLILGLNGIWCSIVVAEFMAVVVTLIFLVVKNVKKYGYW